MDFFVYALSYRLAVIAAGTIFMFFGYRLFMQGIVSGEGAEMGGEHGETKLWIKNAAPGTFFALFGTMLIGLMVWQGNPRMETSDGDSTKTTTLLRGGFDTPAPDFDLIAVLETATPTKDQIAIFANRLSEPALSLEAASDPLLGLAATYLRDNRPDEAISLVRLVYQVSGDRADTLALMAMVENARGDTALARKVAGRLSLTHPDRVDLIEALKKDMLP